MSLAGPHDRLPSWPTAAPAQPAGFPALPLPGLHQRRTGRHRHPANPQRRGSRRSSATPAHRGNRSVQPRLPEIDTGRTLIARSSTGSVGPGERIGQRGGAGEHPQTLADRAQQNTCSVRHGPPYRTARTEAISAARRAFSRTFSITQRDGIYRRSPISTFDSAPSTMPIARTTTSPSQSPAPGRSGKVASYQRELVLAPPG
jgi:hypothetical protein